MTNRGCSAPPREAREPERRRMRHAGVAAKPWSNTRQASTAKRPITEAPMSATIAVPKACHPEKRNARHHQRHRHYSCPHSLDTLGAAAAVRRPAAHPCRGALVKVKCQRRHDRLGRGLRLERPTRGECGLRQLDPQLRSARTRPIRPDAHDRNGLLHGLGRAGILMQALSGLDIALWDIRGKLERASVSTLLAGRSASASKPMRRYIAICGRCRTRETQHGRRRWIRGYRHIKLHERTAEAVAAARSLRGLRFRSRSIPMRLVDRARPTSRSPR